MSASSGLASIVVDEKIQFPAVTDELRAKIAGSRRRAFLTPVIVVALVTMVVGFGGGFATGFFVRQPMDSQPTIHFDVDAEIDLIMLTCSRSDLNGDSDTVSEKCLLHISDRVHALEQLMHTHPTTAAHFANASRAISARRKLWGSSSRSTPACDGEWTGTCCRGNRPGPATGPSPLCRSGVMNGCGCDPITGNCQRDAYECSWWNGFCWLFCHSYDEVRYCNFCGNPSE